MRVQIITILLCFQSAISFGQTSLKEMNLKQGKHEVGFKHYIVNDSTRTHKRLYDWNNQIIPRPIPISIWYPSNDQTKVLNPIRILNYMEILKQEEEWEHLPNEQILNWFYYQNTIENRNHLKETTIAYLNIEVANGKFPVIVYAPSYQASSIENFALCEYLASYGYIIISSPSKGTENRFLEGGTEKDLETQARDIEFLLKEASKLSSADVDRIATMGFSFGGLSNVLAQMRNQHIKAVLSLDGSIKYLYPILKKSPFYNLEKFDVPFIHMAQKDIPEQVLKEDNISDALNGQFEFYDSIHNSKAYKLKFHNLAHSSFSSLGVLFEQRDTRQEKSDPEIMESYKLASTYSLKFLDAFLKNDSEALAFINNKPENNGIKNGIISHHLKDPKKQPFLFEDFNELASNQNYEDLDILYQTVLKSHPLLQLPENKLNNLGLQLVFNPKTSEHGIKVFLFATKRYPNSANLYDSLAEAYLFIKDYNKAKDNFEKSLVLNPQNKNATVRLKELKKGFTQK